MKSTMETVMQNQPKLPAAFRWGHRLAWFAIGGITTVFVMLATTDAFLRCFAN